MYRALFILAILLLFIFVQDDPVKPVGKAVVYCPSVVPTKVLVYKVKQHTWMEDENGDTINPKPQCQIVYEEN